MPNSITGQFPALSSPWPAGLAGSISGFYKNNIDWKYMMVLKIGLNLKSLQLTTLCLHSARILSSDKQKMVTHEARFVTCEG